MLTSNRRDFLKTVICGAAGISFSYRAFGQAGGIEVTKLTDVIAVLTGDGGNVGLVIGKDGLMMIDGGLKEQAEDLQQAVASVDAHKVQILFNTHWHVDHVGSNELLGSGGTKIVAHENVKKRLSMTVVSDALGQTFQPLDSKGIPAETFSKGGKMTFGTTKLEFAYVPNIHTDNDSYVFFPEANILHTGDMFFKGFYPYIDYSTGGLLSGMASAWEHLAKVGDAKTRVIPGHGPIGTKADLKASCDMLATVFSRLEPMAKKGMTEKEVVKAEPTKDLDAKWGKFVPADMFLHMAYGSLLKHSTNA
jgi:glyoxylase-like metal-dependent hydrolase (beta-lactamase superfamily II)